MTMKQEIPTNREAPTQELPRHDLMISGLMEDMDIPEGMMISDRDIGFAAGLLDVMHKKHGDPSSPDFKTYHNVGHDMDVLKRSWQIWSSLSERLPDTFDQSGYRTLLFGACGHDLFVEQDTLEGKDEKRSGKFTMRRMITAGYGLDEASEVFEVINATAVKRDQNGSIIQYNLRKGSKNPKKFVLATADINGIPMGGIPTMMRDALNLNMEFSHISMSELMHHPKKAVGFMLTQADFLEDRLAAMDGDIDYHFEGKEREIARQVMSEQFSGSSREALELASRMKNAPDLAETAICSVLESANKGAGSISSLPAKIGRMLTSAKDRPE